MRPTAPSLPVTLCVLLALSPSAVLAQKGASTQPALSGSDRVEAMTQELLNQLRIAQDRHWHKGEYCHIVSLTRAIVAGDPHDLESYANSGWLLWSMDKDDDAIALYKQGIAANPQTYYMFDELGQYYYNRKKDMVHAAAYLEKAVGQPDCKARAYHTLAHAYEKLGQLAKARDVWQRAVDLAENDSRPAAKVNLERVTRLLNPKSPK